jgi:hypothetical protein
MWMVSDDGWMNCFSIFKASSPVLAAAVADHVSCWPILLQKSAMTGGGA